MHSYSRLGDRLGALGPHLEPSWELLALFRPPLGSTWPRFADMQDFIVFRWISLFCSLFFCDFSGAGSQHRLKLRYMRLKLRYIGLKMRYMRLMLRPIRLMLRHMRHMLRYIRAMLRYMGPI